MSASVRRPPHSEEQSPAPAVLPDHASQALRPSARAAAQRLTHCLATDLGPVALFPDRDALATGFLALHPQLSPHHATPALTVHQDGRVEFDGALVHPALQPFIEVEVQHVITKHLDQLRSTPVPAGLISVSGNRLHLRIGSGRATITDHGGELTVNWATPGAVVSWTVLTWGDSPLNPAELARCSREDQGALLQFHSELGIAHRQPADATPAAVALATLQISREQMEAAMGLHRRHWMQSAI